jgi:hypothetical protein
MLTNVKISFAQKERDLVGYLSLHRVATAMNGPGLVLKWTPNQMMKGEGGGEAGNINFWEMALHVDMSSCVYAHCHRGQLVLIGCDGK